MDEIMDEFDEYVRDAEMHLERAKALKEKAKSTAHLVRYMLNSTTPEWNSRRVMVR